MADRLEPPPFPDAPEPRSPDDLDPSKCVLIADELEDVILAALRDNPSAAMVQAARQYLKDQGFVAAKRPNANLIPITEAVAAAAADEVPFPVPDDTHRTGA